MPGAELRQGQRLPVTEAQTALDVPAALAGLDDLHGGVDIGLFDVVGGADPLRKETAHMRERVIGGPDHSLPEPGLGGDTVYLIPDLGQPVLPVGIDTIELRHS